MNINTLSNNLIVSALDDRYEAVIDSLAKQNYAIAENFFNNDIIQGLSDQLEIQIEEENLRLAGIGLGADFDKNKAIRSDKIKWISENSLHLAENLFLAAIQHFSDYLNRTCYAGIRNREFHYAVYEKGTFYKRHLDQFKLDDSRKFSVITYFNKDWKETDGGQLILFIDGEEIKIQPEWGKTVFLKSDVVEHEVSLSHRQRKSVTGWLR